VFLFISSSIYLSISLLHNPHLFPSFLQSHYMTLIIPLSMYHPPLSSSLYIILSISIYLSLPMCHHCLSIYLPLPLSFVYVLFTFHTLHPCLSPLSLSISSHLLVSLSLSCLPSLSLSSSMLYPYLSILPPYLVLNFSLSSPPTCYLSISIYIFSCISHSLLFHISISLHVPFSLSHPSSFTFCLFVSISLFLLIPQHCPFVLLLLFLSTSLSLLPSLSLSSSTLSPSLKLPPF